MSWLDKLFGLKEHGTTIGTEVRSGATTFMTMAYVAVVQPAIMAACGMPWGAVFTMTVLFSGIFTIWMGLKANFPFAIAPGMGTNAIFAFSIVNAGVASWETAMGMIFWAGMAIVLFSIHIFKWLKWFGVQDEKILNFCIREKVVESIPEDLTKGFGAAIGAFLFCLGWSGNGIGLVSAFDPMNGPIINSVLQPNIIIGFFGVVICAILFFGKGKRFNVRGAILITMLAVTALMMVLGLAPLPEKIVAMPSGFTDIVFKLDIFGALAPKCLPFILVFFLGDIFSTTGTALTCVNATGLNKGGKFKKWNEIFFVDAVAAPAGALVGLTTPTAYIESAAGIADGAKTGLSSVVNGLLFILTLFLLPIFASIPPVATGVALVTVGILMFGSLGEINLNNPVISVPIAFMVSLTIYLNDFAFAMCVGLVAWVLMASFWRYVLGKKENLPDLTSRVMALVILVMSVAKLIFTI